MAEGIVIYKSRYGATARYAAWIAEATGFETAESSDAAIRQAADCTAVVFAGGVYASGVAGISLMKKNSAMLAGKRTALLCVGASPWDEGAIALLRARNLKGVLEGVPIFSKHFSCSQKNALKSLWQKHLLWELKNILMYPNCSF